MFFSWQFGVNQQNLICSHKNVDIYLHTCRIHKQTVGIQTYLTNIQAKEKVAPKSCLPGLLTLTSPKLILAFCSPWARNCLFPVTVAIFTVPDLPMNMGRCSNSQLLGAWDTRSLKTWSHLLKPATLLEVSDAMGVAMVTLGSPNSHVPFEDGEKHDHPTKSQNPTNHILVGILLHLKHMKVSWDDEIPNIWKHKKCSKPPTSIKCPSGLIIILCPSRY